tara:strand:- start:733 stop:882 length:150 start_codon:yes stop_codon:yes gene_type:complete
VGFNNPASSNQARAAWDGLPVSRTKSQFSGVFIIPSGAGSARRANHFPV